MLDLARHEVALFIWFCQHLRVQVNGPMARPFLDEAFALIHQIEGASSLRRGNKQQRLSTGGVALTQPRDALVLSAGSRLDLLVFDLLRRPRPSRLRDNGRFDFVIPPGQPQPLLSQLLGHEVPPLLGPEWAVPAAQLIAGVIEFHMLHI